MGVSPACEARLTQSRWDVSDFVRACASASIWCPFRARRYKTSNPGLEALGDSVVPFHGTGPFGRPDDAGCHRALAYIELPEVAA